MWIRSQDRKILTKIDDLAIDGANQIWGDCCLLGKYSSKEKALMVLDKIESYLEYSHNIVFQMPQNDEVGL
ncbi:hypothetical protein [Holdemanella biformis]|uniref:hypothetical protein n=1 Tax=Holdemanella biformis TaxID=1735 RepID=UPI002666735D|nr:hypothetical protein [Holdemanella biformis]